MFHTTQNILLIYFHIKLTLIWRYLTITSCLCRLKLYVKSAP